MTPNPAHRWLAQRDANRFYQYAERNYHDERSAYLEAERELQALPEHVVWQAELERAGQALLPFVT